FEPFFDFLARHPEIKGFNYMSQDYRSTRYAANGWGDARIQANRYIKEAWIAALRGDRFLHARDDASDVASGHSPGDSPGNASDEAPDEAPDQGGASSG